MSKTKFIKGVMASNHGSREGFNWIRERVSEADARMASPEDTVLIRTDDQEDE